MYLLNFPSYGLSSVLHVVGYLKKRSIKKYCLWETYSTLENARRARLEPSANNGQQRGVGSYYKWCCNVLLRNCWRGRKWFSVSTTEPNFLHSVAETLIFFIYTFSVTWSLVLSFLVSPPCFSSPSPLSLVLKGTFCKVMTPKECRRRRLIWVGFTVELASLGCTVIFVLGSHAPFTPPFAD